MMCITCFQCKIKLDNGFCNSHQKIIMHINQKPVKISQTIWSTYSAWGGCAWKMWLTLKKTSGGGHNLFPTKKSRQTPSSSFKTNITRNWRNAIPRLNPKCWFTRIKHTIPIPQSTQNSQIFKQQIKVCTNNTGDKFPPNRIQAAEHTLLLVVPELNVLAVLEGQYLT